MEYTKTFDVTPGTESDVTITGEIPYSELEAHRAAALEELGKDIEVEGFRKGHVPEKMLVDKIGEGRLLQEMAERALARAYPRALKEHNIDAIGHPKISITKLAPENPLGFTATVAVMPDVTLPNYKALAKEVNGNAPSAEVTDEDVEKQMKDIMRQRIAYERLQQKAAQQQSESSENEKGAADLPTPETVSKNEDAPTDPSEIAESDLPELTDEYVKGLGQDGQFASVDDFKSKIREHLTIEKEREAAAKHRGALTDRIIEETELTVPEVMIDAELNQMFAQMEEEIKRANLSMDDYLNHIKKSREDLKTEWRPAAEKRAKLQLVLNAIAQNESTTPDADAIEAQVAELKKQYPDADEAKVRTYVASVLTNEAVLKMLEEQK